MTAETIHTRGDVRGLVGYVDGSRLRELRDGRLNIALWAEPMGSADTPVYTIPAPPPPADAEQQGQAVVWVSTADIAPFVGAPQMAEFWGTVTLASGPGDGRTVPLYLTAPPSAPVGVEGRYHPCTHILIDGLKRLEGGTAVLAEWDRARAQADAALAQQPAAVDGGDVRRVAQHIGTAADALARAERLTAALIAQQPAAGDEFVTIDGRRYDVDTVRTALLGLASDLAAQHQEPTNDRRD
jgi:hypothetical protein